MVPSTIFILIATIYTGTPGTSMGTSVGTSVISERMYFDTEKECLTELGHMKPMMERYIVEDIQTELRCAAYTVDP
jgi:hypothetical protein